MTADPVTEARTLGATVVVERSLPVEWPNGGTT